jgi:hypothetical protein
MQSDKKIVRNLRFRQLVGLAAISGVCGLQLWHDSGLSRTARMVIDVLMVLAWVAICLYIVRVIIPIQELRRANPE